MARRFSPFAAYASWPRQRRIATALLLTIFVAFAMLLIWAAWAELDVITRAPGVVVPSSRIQSIQSLDGGVLADMAVKEGDIVQAGQVLLHLDRVKAEAQYRESLSRVASLKAGLTRLRAEVLSRPLVFPEEISEFQDIIQAQTTLYQKRRNALLEEIAVLERTLKLAEKELDLNEPMLKTGEVSEVDVIRLRRQVNEIRGTITQRQNKYLSDAQTELAKVEEDLAAQSEILAARRDQLAHTDIVAPVRGVVKNIRFNTVGGVVRPAEEILQLVPIDEELLIEVKIKPQDVAFLRTGLPVTVKIDAYDYSIYGVLHGELTYLSADTLKDETAREDIRYYRGIVRTTGSKLRNPKAERIEILPGMTAAAEIKTGERTVLKYLLKPITKSLSESLYER